VPLERERVHEADGASEKGSPDKGGLRIDLARNFRSRQEVVDGVNFLFRQMMREHVAEIEYDEGAELKYGNGFPPPVDEESDLAVELLVVERDSESVAGDRSEFEASSGDDEAEDGQAEGEDTSDLQAA